MRLAWGQARSLLWSSWAGHGGLSVSMTGLGMRDGCRPPCCDVLFTMWGQQVRLRVQARACLVGVAVALKQRGGCWGKGLEAELRVGVACDRCTGLT